MGQLLLVKDHTLRVGIGEFADTEEKEIQIAVDAAITAIEKHRQKRMGEHNTREYYKRLQTTSIAPKRTYDQLKTHMSLNFPKFKIDRFNEDQYDLLLRYFSGCETLLDKGLSLNKGICLMGGVGVGKTSLMRMFSSNQVQSYVVRQCLDIAKAFSVNGSSALDEYSEPQKTFSGSNIYGHEILGVCFDDLGTENDQKHFGNSSNVMADVILRRYDKMNMSRQLTHFTTNLTPRDIEERYGTRVMDRIKEMFNLITFSPGTPSRRQ